MRSGTTKACALWFIVWLTAACGASLPHGVTVTGGDGSSCDDAIVILGATTEHHGIAAEYSVLIHRYGEWRRLSQSLTSCGERRIDMFELKSPAGVKREVYFDISDFFGKH